MFKGGYLECPMLLNALSRGKMTDKGIHGGLPYEERAPLIYLPPATSLV